MSAVPAARSGFALAFVIGALVLAAVLAAAAVTSARLGVRDAMGVERRAAARAAADGALARALLPSEWDSAWLAPGPAGLVGVRIHGAGELSDTVRVTRLGARSYVVVVEAVAGVPPAPVARSRVSMVALLDAGGWPRRIVAHAWTDLP